MKIAIPTIDKTNISGHFGRAPGFMICETDQHKVTGKTYKPNNFTGHAQGHHHSAQGHGNHGNHSHQGIFEAIGDCEVVIAGGMGRRLFEEFKQKQIQVFVTREKNIDAALQRFLEGRLDSNDDGCCEH